MKCLELRMLLSFNLVCRTNLFFQKTWCMLTFTFQQSKPSVEELERRPTTHVSHSAELWPKHFQPRMSNSGHGRSRSLALSNAWSPMWCHWTASWPPPPCSIQKNLKKSMRSTPTGHWIDSCEALDVEELTPQKCYVKVYFNALQQLVIYRETPYIWYYTVLDLF